MANSDQSRLGEEVQSLYDEYPYPAHGIVSSVIPRMIRASLEDQFRRLGRRDLRVLDAGCGTGEQTLGLARAFPELEVVGIDITRPSLAFARDLAARHKLSVEFVRADLSRPLSPSLGTFDVITSIGVLHSLPDTPAGFRHVRAVARPGALFMGMVYGKFGRSHYNLAREVLALLGARDDSRDVQLRILQDNGLARNASLLHYADVLANRVRFGPSIDPVEALRRVVKGRSAQYQADGYTHVKDTAYTWGELIDLLSETGWSFEGWPRRSGMPDAPEQLFRGLALERVAKLGLREQAAVYERLVMPGNLFFLARPAEGGVDAEVPQR